MGSRSHDLEAELRMHSFTINCDTFSIKDKVSVVVPVTSVEVKFYENMLAYFVGVVLDEKTGKVSTRVNSWQYFIYI